MKLASGLFLATGLESVIFPQIFNQEKVRQEKIRQDRKRSRVIHKTMPLSTFSFPEASQRSIQHYIFQVPCLPMA